MEQINCERKTTLYLLLNIHRRLKFVKIKDGGNGPTFFITSTTKQKQSPRTHRGASMAHTAKRRLFQEDFSS